MLNPDELAFIKDPAYPLAKQAIDGKVSHLLLATQEALIECINDHEIVLPAAVSLTRQKVNRGENYQGMPYWVSDFPAKMSKNDIFTYRIAVWWGHEISYSLIRKGQFKPQQLPDLNVLEGLGLYYCIYNDPWRLEFSEDNLIPVSDQQGQSIQEHYERQDFVKLSIRSNLEKLTELAHLGKENFVKFAKAFTDLA